MKAWRCRRETRTRLGKVKFGHSPQELRKGGRLAAVKGVREKGGREKER